jgi:hypothetical protein
MAQRVLPKALGDELDAMKVRLVEIGHILAPGGNPDDVLDGIDAEIKAIHSRIIEIRPLKDASQVAAWARRSIAFASRKKSQERRKLCVRSAERRRTPRPPSTAQFGSLLLNDLDLEEMSLGDALVTFYPETLMLLSLLHYLEDNLDEVNPYGEAVEVEQALARWLRAEGITDRDRKQLST